MTEGRSKTRTTKKVRLSGLAGGRHVKGVRWRKVWAHFKGSFPNPRPRLKHRGPLEKRRCRCRLQLAAHGRGSYGPRATGHGPGYRRSRKSSSNQQRPGLLGLLACWFPCANLPSGAIGGTARLPGSASFLQGSTVPFHSYWRFPPSFLRRAYSDPPHHGLEPPSIKLCF